MTLDWEFQKPVRDKLAEIVIPDPLAVLPDWGLDLKVPPTNYDQWMRQAQSFQDTQRKLHAHQMNEITHAPDVGVLSGQFPSPRKRKRVRNKK